MRLLISAECEQKRFYFSLVTSVVLQSACLWLLSVVHSATQSSSPYVVVPLASAKPVFYQRSRIPYKPVNDKWIDRRTIFLAKMRGPVLNRKPEGAGYQPDAAAPVIGNPELGVAAPLMLSFDQPSRPVEIRVGDYGVERSVAGSPHSGRGTRNGFMESGFGGGYGGQKQIDREPVRIISKPTPIYTHEARDQKIEGDVVVDVIFTAGGRIVVVRIIRTLGYGLDETAVRAVSQIVFRPATENGRAVDFEARAWVEFRLVPKVQLFGDETQ